MAGTIDAESRHITLHRNEDEDFDPRQLLGHTPRRSRATIEQLLSANADRTPLGKRGTTMLHPPVGVIAIAVKGTLCDIRERNVAYVVDYLGQPRSVLDHQVKVIGNVVLNNTRGSGDRPHLLVVGPPTHIDLAREILDSATETLNRLDDGKHFTKELTIRHETGQFEVVFQASNVRQ